MTKRKLNERAGDGEQVGSVLSNEVIAKELARMTSHRNGRRASRQLFFDEHWLAARWGIEVKTIQKWRYDGVGPAWHKFGENGSVRYRLRDVVAFEKKCRTGSTAEPADIDG